MPTPQTLPIRLRVVCLNPPPIQRDGQTTAFGLQDKKGELQPGQTRQDGSLVFACDVQAKPGENDSVNFLGAFTHGTVAGRFLYLSLRYANGGDQGWIRRMKISLSGIRWAQVELAHRNHQTLEAVVDGRGAATVPLIGGGWTLRD